MHALFRRIVFNILISNTDDHLRNHGFVFDSPGGWQLAPAYDLNPVPLDVKPRGLSTEIDIGDATASLDLLLLTAKRHLRRSGIFSTEVLRANAHALDVEESRTVDALLDELAALGTPGFDAV